MERATKILRMIKCSPKSMALKKSKPACEAGTDASTEMEANHTLKESSHCQIKDKYSIAPPAKKKIITLEELEKESEDKITSYKIEAFSNIGPTKTKCDVVPNGCDVDPKSVIDFARNKIKTLKKRRIVARNSKNIALARNLSKSIQMYRNIIEEIFDRKPTFIALEAEFYSSDSDSSSSSDKAESLEDITSSETIARKGENCDIMAEPLVHKDTMESRNNENSNDLAEPSVHKETTARNGENCDNLAEPSVHKDNIESRNNENSNDLAEPSVDNGNGSVRRKLQFDNISNELVTATATMNKTPHPSYNLENYQNCEVSPNKRNCEVPTNKEEMVKFVRSNLNILKQQRGLALRNGKISSSRRKSKIIKLYDTALKEIYAGKIVDPRKLPLPSPRRKPSNPINKVDNTQSVQCEEESVINNEDNLTVYPILSQVDKTQSVHCEAESIINNEENLTANSIQSQSIMCEVESVNNNEDSMFEEAFVEKPKPRGKKRNYCMYCNKLVKEYCVHIEKHHGDTPEGKELRSVTEEDSRRRGKIKREITDKLRKKANSIYNEMILKEKNNDEVNIHRIIPVKKRNTSEITDDNTSICNYCKGYYKKDRMTIHLKKCKEFISQCNTEESGDNMRKCLKNHMVPLSMVGEIEGSNEELKNEVLCKMNDDDVKKCAMNDPLIMKFGSRFHKSKRSDVHRNYVSSKIRDLAHLVLEMKKIDPRVKNLEDCMSPAQFDNLMIAVLNLSKYNPKSGQLQVPSVAYRISQPLRIAATIAKGDALSQAYSEGKNDFSRVTKLNHFQELVSSQWSLNIGKLATNMRKEAAADKIQTFALTEDIVSVCSHIVGNYRSLMSKLQDHHSKKNSYDELMQLLITHIMCLVRRRPVDFKRATLFQYGLIDQQDKLIDMVKGLDAGNKEINEKIDEAELDNCKNFHIFFVPGKNLELVPIVLTPLMKEVLDCLVKQRKNVGIVDRNPKNDKLFLLSNNMSIDPVTSLRKVKSRLNLKSPQTFTNNGLRHQAATFSRLHSSHPQYQDFLASVLGHTLLIHKKHYELPTSIIQKLVVCPILHKMTIGVKGGQRTMDNGPDTFNTTNRKCCNMSNGENASCSKDTFNSTNRKSCNILSEENASCSKETTARAGENCDNMAEPSVHKETTARNGENCDNLAEPSVHKDRKRRKCSKISYVEEEETEDNSQRLDFDCSDESDFEFDLESNKHGYFQSKKRHCSQKRKWTEAEKLVIFKKFGNQILNREFPSRSKVKKFYEQHRIIFDGRSFESLHSFINNLSKRKQLNVSPMIKKFVCSK